MTHPLRMPNGIGDACRATTGQPEQVETVQAGGIDNRSQVLHLGVQRQVGRSPVRQSAPPHVVANQGPFPAQVGEPVSVDVAIRSRWVSQVAARTSAGPRPCASHAIRTPSRDTAKRMFMAAS